MIYFSGENEEVLGIDNKAMLTQDLTIVEEGSLGSGGEDQSAVEHLSPQTLLETSPDNEGQYSFRSPDGTVTYRVLQVEDGMETMPQFISSSSLANAGVTLTSQLNGRYKFDINYLFKCVTKQLVCSVANLQTTILSVNVLLPFCIFCDLCIVLMLMSI